ncbi:sulfatase-like hydrolase/transferase [Limnovirga soli]|uniref:Sulfatase-like hydrolase/transferase n=1 Tax=Limnovirga soli TaxID=2656915 RepID=A0A8J8FBX7_9BACT|nr:sulfatase-like hydrolase/transferase [Limnovirga soli]NNV55183.1 sulfatase-like hydrolase/transferase [Limnovirga soli]
MNRISTFFITRLCCVIIVSCAFFSCRKIEDTNLLTTASGNEMQSVLQATAQPNILIILGDDIGYEIPTCNGGQSYTTPNLDKMASFGMRFTQCHASPLCSPSRFMLLTGKYNFRNYTQWGHMDQGEKTIGNMFKDAGYATCYTGKWQLDGGDASAKIFGWDRYSLWLPFLWDNEYMEGSRYKGAKIYQDGGYLPQEQTIDKYADDEFTDYLLNFIDSTTVIKKPFFAYYAMDLSHSPMSPTPDDAEYATWDFNTPGNGEPRFFPSMVKYMDKKIGEILAHLYKKGLLNNTIVFYMGDNGTPPNITSMFNGFSVVGGKHSTNEPGTNVPLLALWNGKIKPGSTSDRLVDFTDFLPTLADIARIPKPISYGSLDGFSFYNALVTKGKDTTKRSWIYDAHSPEPAATIWRNWVQNDEYKLYDTGKYSQAGQFVKIEKAKPDFIAIPDNQLTSDEIKLKQSFQAVLNSYH